MANDRTPGRYPYREPEQCSSSRLVELFSSSRDFLYGDDDLPSRMDEHEAEPLHGTPSRQPSALRLLNSAYESASHEASQMEDLHSDGDITGVEQMQEEISTESEQVLLYQLRSN